ncbi:choice-of-anchor A family protein [Salinimonas marina]|uniref:Choice-of-anchor A family protein n=1 Tax=Salinimonas marina TaxID=2785918 RepID=A0A7S9DY89_9ALTE|nr:choice-of-anchor A family protein [Salinimonas marina]QPG06083.1 choice-of-anchor A family protein [Salinimonas marina]
MKLRKTGIVAGLLACSVSLPLTAAPFYLGDAANFNAYILQDMHGRNSDVEGRLAVAGNVDIKDYGIGLQLPENATQPVLVVGQDATVRDARIYHGDATAGGTIDIDDSVGLYDEGEFNNTHQFYADSSFDFAGTNTQLLAKSELWGQYEATSKVQINGDGTTIWDLTLTGDADINIFSIDAADFSSPNKSLIFDVPSTSYNIINVYGESVELFNTGFHYADGSKITDNRPEDGPAGRHTGRVTNNLLFNFVDATELLLHGVGFKGSILAPLADTTFYNGHIDGHFIVGNLQTPDGEQTGQVNDYRFGDFVDVSEPGTWAVMMAALAGLGWRRWLKRKAA